MTDTIEDFEFKNERTLHFFIPLARIPTVTAQEKGERIKNGKIIHYDKPEIADTKQLFMAHLAKHLPKEPFVKGKPLRVILTFGFPWSGGKKGPDMAYKRTKPDCDNLAKLFLDCMTRVGFWDDDQQIVSLQIEKLNINIDNRADNGRPMDTTGISVFIGELPEMEKWDYYDWRSNYCL